MASSRRRFLLWTAASAPAAAAGGRRDARAQGASDPARAARFVQSTGQELVAALDSDAPLERRRQQVAAVLRRAVDVEGVGRFVLGRWWRQASPAEQAEYLRLFEETLVRNLSARFDEYRGVRFSLGRAPQRAEEDVLVNAVVERPGTPPFSLDWRIGDVNGQPKVVDVVAEGTSLRLTQRGEYSAVVQRNNGQVSALLAAMREQVQRLAAREGR